MGLMGFSTLPNGVLLVFMPDAAGGRDLPGGQPVNLVVHGHVRQIHVAAHGVDEMIAADAEAVAVAAGDHHLSS